MLTKASVGSTRQHCMTRRGGEEDWATVSALPTPGVNLGERPTECVKILATCVRTEGDTPYGRIPRRWTVYGGSSPSSFSLVGRVRVSKKNILIYNKVTNSLHFDLL